MCHDAWLVVTCVMPCPRVVVGGCGAGGVFGFGGVGVWCWVGRGVVGLILGFLNVVVCQHVSVFVWCEAYFADYAQFYFHQPRILL